MEISMIAPSRLEVRDIGKVTVVTFVDKVIDGKDDRFIDAIGEELFELVREEKKNFLLLDMENVTRMEALMYGKLVALRKHHLPSNGKLRVCNVCDNLFRVFDRMRIVTFLGVLQNTNLDTALLDF